MVTFDFFTNAHHQPKIVQMQLQEGGDPLVQTKTLINNNVQGIVVVPRLNGQICVHLTTCR